MHSPPPFADEASIASYLDGKPRDALLTALTEDDPLRLAERCARYTLGEALFVDADRLANHTIARVVARARIRPRELPIDEWLHDCIERAAKELLAQDREDEREGKPVPAHVEARYSFVCRTLLIPEEDGRRACVAFNGLDPRVRQAFFALIIERRSVTECLEMGFAPADWLRDAVLDAFWALLDLGDTKKPRSNRQVDGGSDGR